MQMLIAVASRHSGQKRKKAQNRCAWGRLPEPELGLVIAARINYAKHSPNIGTSIGYRKKRKKNAEEECCAVEMVQWTVCLRTANSDSKKKCRSRSPHWSAPAAASCARRRRLQSGRSGKSRCNYHTSVKTNVGHVQLSSDSRNSSDSRAQLTQLRVPSHKYLYAAFSRKTI